MAEPMVATKKAIEEIFDGAAPRYDKIGPGFFRKFGEQLVQAVAIKAGERVLDVGTGAGAILVPAGRAVGTGGAVIGIDISNEMLAQAEHAARTADLYNYQLGRMDAEHLELPDQSFDVVTCGFSLFFFPSMEGALAETFRVLKPGGRVGITTWGKTPPPFDPAWKIFAEMVRQYGVEVRMPNKVAFAPEEVRDLLKNSGFFDIEIRTEPCDVLFPNLEEWWTYQTTLGARAAIFRMSEEMRERFKTEYLANLRSLIRADGVHLPVSVIYGVGRRP